MRKRDLERHLRANGCELIRQGAGHEVWQGPAARSTVPRHREIPVSTAKSICKQLGVSPPPFR